MKNTTKYSTTATAVKTKLISMATCLLLATTAHAQQDQEAEVKKTIETFIKGLENSDTALAASVTDKSISLKTITEKKDGTVVIRNESRKELIMLSIAKKHEEKYEERITSWSIKTDGAYASVWCDYEFYIDNTLSHYGIDNFELVRDKGNWKITSITDTRHKSSERAFTLQAATVNERHDLKDEKTLVAEVGTFLDNWHRAAAKADEKAYFGVMDPTCIYMGTDKTEHWTTAEFEKWSKNQFERETAWDFKPYDRHIYFSQDKTYAWFDELLDTWMGVCRGSGVLEWQEKERKWIMKQYNLAVTIDNDKIEAFIKINK